MKDLDEVAEKKKKWIVKYCNKIEENAKESEITYMYHRM